MTLCGAKHSLHDGREVRCALVAGHDSPKLKAWDRRTEHFARACVTWEDEPVAQLPLGDADDRFDEVLAQVGLKMPDSKGQCDRAEGGE